MNLKEKISQMFILGFSGTRLNSANINIQNLIKNGLGGIIFFAENIDSYDQIRNLSEELQALSEIPLFISIDQEGGLVERTINIKNKIDYLTPMALASTENSEFIENHTRIMAQELKFMGVNMDFAPVLDVNTNPNNPIIGIRSFGSNTEDVIKYSEPVYETFAENNIIPVGKHFPGHGETSVDSHLDMPVVDLSFEELENIHVKPFRNAINKGLDSLMISHVFYKAFPCHCEEARRADAAIYPASLSGEIITGYLKEKLNFKGLIISDDMVMGGISKHYDYSEACIKGINAGIDLFIFRNSDDEILKLIDKLTEAAEKGLVSLERIDESVNKILFIKKKYGISKISGMPDRIFIENIEKFQKIIDKIALKSIKIEKKGALLPLNKEKNYLILSPDKSKIFNLSKDFSKISDFLTTIKCKEIVYSLNPEKEEINNILKESESFDAVIFIEYNSVFYKNQSELLKKIKAPVILINTGAPNIFDESLKIDSLIASFCMRKPSVKALAHIIQYN